MTGIGQSIKGLGFILFFVISIGFTPLGRADAFSFRIRSGHPGDDRPPLPEFLPDEPGRGLKLPPPLAGPDALGGGPEFELKGVLFKGNTIFPDKELHAVATPFLGTLVSIADLEEIRYRLTRKYVDKGYINSGVVLEPDQEVTGGIIGYQVLEGRLDEVKVTGSGRLRTAYIEKRLWPDSNTPFNIFILQERFQRLLQDPLIERMNGRIRPGILPGEAFLDLDVVRARPYDFQLVADNYRNPSTGSEGACMTGTLWNLSGLGDRLDTTLDFSRGGSSGSARFMLPVNDKGTRLSVGLEKSRSTVIEEPLDNVDIESELQNFNLNLTHPFLTRLGRQFEAGLTLAVRKSETFLLDQPFSFTRGAEDGKTKVTALRLIQTYIDRTPVTALTLRSALSYGLDLFDATVHDVEQRPDGKFVSWLGQMQYARLLGSRWGQLILRADVQLANDNLLSLEQFALGGADSVRGYRENERVRDNGYFFSVEWRYPLWKKGKDKYLQAAVFTDLGSAWNKGESAGDNFLQSIGIGLLWKLNRLAKAGIYLAHDLEKASDKYEYNLQDDGIHLRFTIDFFQGKE